MKFYESYTEISIYNLNQFIKTNNLKYLCRTRIAQKLSARNKSIANKHLNVILLEAGMINQKALQVSVDISLMKFEIEILKCDGKHLESKSVESEILQLQDRIDVLEFELRQMKEKSNDESNKSFYSDREKAILEKYMGFMIDPKRTTVSQYINYRNIYEEQAESDRRKK